MRWKAKKPVANGEVRIVNRFLWFPVKLNGEVRWLEWAKIEQHRERVYTFNYFGTYEDFVWEDVNWVNL